MPLPDRTLQLFAWGLLKQVNPKHRFYDLFILIVAHQRTGHLPVFFSESCFYWVSSRIQRIKHWLSPACRCSWVCEQVTSFLPELPICKIRLLITWAANFFLFNFHPAGRAWWLMVATQHLVSLGPLRYDAKAEVANDGSPTVCPSMLWPVGYANKVYWSGIGCQEVWWNMH